MLISKWNPINLHIYFFYKYNNISNLWYLLYNTYSFIIKPEHQLIFSINRELNINLLFNYKIFFFSKKIKYFTNWVSFFFLPFFGSYILFYIFDFIPNLIKLSTLKLDGHSRGKVSCVTVLDSTLLFLFLFFRYRRHIDNIIRKWKFWVGVTILDSLTWLAFWKWSRPSYIITHVPRSNDGTYLLKFWLSKMLGV